MKSNIYIKSTNQKDMNDSNRNVKDTEFHTTKKSYGHNWKVHF